MNSFILIDGVIFWIVFSLILLALFAMLLKSILKLRTDRHLVRENRRLQEENRFLSDRLYKRDFKVPEIRK